MPVITNTASGEGIQNGEMVSLVSNTATLNVTVLASGSLSKMFQDETINPGETTTVSIVVTATDNPIEDFILRDAIDSRLTLVTDSVQVNGIDTAYTYVGGVLTVDTNQNVNPGSPMTITFQVTAN